MPLEIPAYPSGLRAQLMADTIARKPSAGLFRGAEISLRMEQPSLMRQVQAAGFNAEVQIEALLVLATDAPDPRPNDAADYITAGGSVWRIITSDKDPGDGCWRLGLARVRKAQS